MRRWLFVPTLAVASLVLAGPAGATSTKDSFGLKGEVYAEGFKIEMKNELLRRARLADRTLSAEIRRAITEHLRRPPNPEANHADQ